MRQNIDLSFIPAMLHELFFYKFARSQKQIHAILVRLQPFVGIGLERKHGAGAAASGVAAFTQYVPEASSLATLASISPGNHVVCGAEQLEIIQVVNNRNFVGLQLPEYGR